MLHILFRQNRIDFQAVYIFGTKVTYTLNCSLKYHLILSFLNLESLAM
jgi:hypothetical protein